MSTHVPRPAYNQTELDQLYPSHLQLKQVQVILRHGERSPTKARFQNAGLAPYWPYCDTAKRFTSAVMETTDWSRWGSLAYRRRIETFGDYDVPSIAKGPRGEEDGVCQLGELTNKGRETTLALGERLRRLYIDQLQFIPDTLVDSDIFYIRSTPMPRALESVQQAFVGLYPQAKRDPLIPPPVVYTRSFADETLFPNDWNCKRLGELSAAFAQRCAERWNGSKEVGYLNKKFGKWMPEASPKIGVDSSPRLSGIMDTINATAAHGPETKLPREFYDPKALDIINDIAVEEWYAGYHESQEYRMLGIGALVGDLTTRMVANVDRNGATGITGTRAVSGHKDRPDVRFSLAGAHDTTLAGFLASLGAFDGQRWPPFTSHVAIELFSGKHPVPSNRPVPQSLDQSKPGQPSTSWWASLFGSSSRADNNTTNEAGSAPLARKPTSQLSDADKFKLKDYYVRIRYNDQPVKIPGCRPQGKHLDGDESFCTLEAFKAIADKITPRDWKAQCRENLGGQKIPSQIERAGYD